MLPQKGNWICNDGSRSGMICNIQITDRSEDYFAKGPDGNGKEVMHHYRWGWDAKKRVTSKDSSPVAGRRGDSGGPVILSTGRDDTGTEPNAFAMGIVSASAACGLHMPYRCADHLLQGDHLRRNRRRSQLPGRFIAHSGRFSQYHGSEGSELPGAGTHPRPRTHP